MADQSGFRYRANVDTTRFLREQYRLQKSAAETHRELEDRYGAGNWHVPSAREVRGTFQEWREQEDTMAWDSTSASPAEITAILPVLAAVTHVSSGRVRALTRRTARHVARLCQAFPDMPAGIAFDLASSYGDAEAEARKRGVDELPAVAELDLYLAFTPWRGMDEMERWVTAIRSGAIPEDALAIGLVTWEPRAAARVRTDDATARALALWREQHPEEAEWTLMPEAELSDEP